MRTSTHAWLFAALLSLACSNDKDKEPPDTEPTVGGGGAGGSAGDSSTNGGNAGHGGTSAVTEEETPYSVDGEFPIELQEGLAPTPPMGWSSWNKFACNITADGTKSIADAMVSSGMKDAGYEFINIDDCWQLGSRDAEGNVVVDTDFPDGMKALADYIHERGLKLGLYSDRGTQTCAGRAGAEGFEAKDADTYAAWSIDYLKYDNCAANPDLIESQYKLMRTELDRATASTGRPIVYSICAWRFYEWGIGVGQLWRTTRDITDNWDVPLGDIRGNVTTSFVQNTPLAAYAGPNGWNDPDMLEVGNGGMTLDEQRTHFNLWALMAAPLIAGNDLTKMSDDVKAILTNKDVIAIDQDAYGLQGVPVWTDTTTGAEVWTKPLNEEGARAVLLLNRGTVAQDITVNFDTLGLGRSKVTLQDLWSKEELGEFRGSYTATNVASHASVLLKAKGIEPLPPTGNEYVSNLTWLYSANYAGPVERDLTNGFNKVGDGKPITLDGTNYEKGLGVSAPSSVLLRLAKKCSRFKAKINVDDAASSATTVVFRVFGDGKVLYESDVINGDSKTQSIDVNVENVYRLKLMVSNAVDGTLGERAVWADARLECE